MQITIKEREEFIKGLNLNPNKPIYNFFNWISNYRKLLIELKPFEKSNDRVEIDKILNRYEKVFENTMYNFEYLGLYVKIENNDFYENNYRCIRANIYNTKTENFINHCVALSSIIYVENKNTGTFKNLARYGKIYSIIYWMSKSYYNNDWRNIENKKTEALPF